MLFFLINLLYKINNSKKKQKIKLNSTDLAKEFLKNP